MLCNFMAMGTAIVERPDGKKRIEHTPRMVIDLSGSGLRELEFDDPIADLATARYGSSDDDDDE